jgi:hypothetical protein
VDGLEALIRRGLIREVLVAGDSDVHYDFTHGRLRDVAYEETSLARRRLLHGRGPTPAATGSQAPRAGRASPPMPRPGAARRSGHLRAGGGSRVYAIRGAGALRGRPRSDGAAILRAGRPAR